MFRRQVSIRGLTPSRCCASWFEAARRSHRTCRGIIVERDVRGRGDVVGFRDAGAPYNGVAGSFCPNRSAMKASTSAAGTSRVELLRRW